MKNRKWWLATLLILLMGGALWAYYAGLLGGSAGRLYVYYPQSTGFFVELDAGHKLGHRMLAYLQRKLAANTAGKTAGSAQVLATGDPFQTALLKHFDEVAEPTFSLGVWPDPNQPQMSDASEMLAAMPLKEAMTLDALMARLDLNPKDFESAEFADVTYYIQPASQTSFTIVDADLLLANGPQALQTVLTMQRESEPNIYSEPQAERYLSRLSGRRDGTFILNNAVFAKSALRPGVDHAADQARRLSEVLPMVVGAIDVDSDRHLATRFFAPVIVGEIGNESLRQDLRDFYAEQAKIRSPELVAADTTMVLETAGLDRLFDIYRKYFMDAEGRQRIAGLAGFLQLAQIDFRQDIIGLLEGDTILSAAPMQPVPTVMLETTEDKEQAIDKLSGFLTRSDLPLAQKPEQIGDVSAQTIEVPGKNFSVTYGQTKGMFVVAPTTSFSELVKVWQHDADNLDKLPGFHTLTKHYPAQGNLFVYLDLKRQREFFRAQIDKVSRQTPNAEASSALESVGKNQALEAFSLLLKAHGNGSQGDLLEGYADFLLVPQTTSDDKKAAQKTDPQTHR